MGLALIIGGAYYKIYEPGYALEFVRTHYVNFLPDIGLNFISNEMFVMMVESPRCLWERCWLLVCCLVSLASLPP